MSLSQGFGIEISGQLERRASYQCLEEELARSGDKQISTTDADARSLVLHRDIVAVCYSAQVAADDRHKLLVHYATTNQNDAHALCAAAKAGKAALGVAGVTVLADKGYHTGSQPAACAQEQIATFVAPPLASTPGDGPQPGYRMVDFAYVGQGDYYVCPQGHPLYTNGRYYKKGKAGYRVKHYKTKACEGCPFRQACTKNKLGRLIERSEYQEYTDANRERVEANKERYLKRQEIIEHPCLRQASIWNDQKGLGLYLHPAEGQRESGWGAGSDLLLLQPTAKYTCPVAIAYRVHSRR